MQIRQELPQFKNKFTFLLVSGKEHAVIYKANNSNIKKISEIRVEKEKYSDKEGHFKRSGNRKVISSGAVYEDINKEHRLKEFIEEITKQFNKFKKIDEVYCFYPPYMKNRLKQVVEKFSSKNIYIKGNYTDNHPFALLEKIKNN